MKSWLLSVSAVVLVMVLLELLISEGKIKKYIQGIVRLALVITMFMPIIKFFKSDFNFDISAEKTEINLDYVFLERVHEIRYRNAEKELERDMETAGISGADVHISIYYEGSGSIGVDSVSVNLTDAVISADGENILLIEKVKAIIKARINVSEEKIIIHGSS